MDTNQKPKWPELPWHDVVDRVSPSVFRIYAGNSAGTGFIVSVGYNSARSLWQTMVVTAWHVVQGIAQTNQGVRLVSWDRKEEHRCSPGDVEFRPFGDPRFDTSLMIILSQAPIHRIEDLLPMLPSESMLARGADIGWLGFPGLVEPELCFFSGHVSGYTMDPPSYLVDGVAINGVSGGPVFDNRTHIVGIVSAYLPNRVDSQTVLPGLMVVVPINAVQYYMQEYLKAKVR